MKKWWLALKVAVLSAVTVPVAVSVTVVGALIFLPLPVTLEARSDLTESRVSRVYDIDGNEIAVFREFDQNIPVKPEDIPVHLKNAVISSEDRGFYKHSGIDLRGTARALMADIRGRHVAQGGSTISQQLARLKYKAGEERSLRRKVREAILASQIDRSLEKDEILFEYLSNVYLGEGATGVGAASETYFRKPVNQLTISEAAMLAGLIPAPSFYEPRGNPAGADNKRRIVLEKMLQQDHITQAQYDEAVVQTVKLIPPNGVKPPGPATLIYPPIAEFRKYPYFVDYVEKYLQARGLEPSRGGLRIQTSLDPKLQKEAETAVTNSLRGIAPPIEMAMASVEPPTGFVKSLVGGRDFYAADAGSVNLALGRCPVKPPNLALVRVKATCWDHPESVTAGGGSGRQTGSSWKPFTLTAGFEQGILPTKVYPAPAVYRIPNCKPTPPVTCTIKNSEGHGGGSQNLRTATAQSTNTVYAALEHDVGPEKSVEVAKRLGVASAFYYPRDHGVAGVTLGVLSTAPLEMAAAYSVFANRGERLEATPIVKVVDSAGKVIIDNTKRKGERVLDEIIADNVTDLLRGVITSGTGQGLDIGRPAAGKTGTTNEFTDAWFVGYTPTLSTAVWMGNRTGSKTLRVRGRNVFGATIPGPTWKAFMIEALKDVPITDFNEPAPIKNIADALSRKARKGFDPGPRRSPSEVGDGGRYEIDLPPPQATEPTTTTSSTSTTTPRGGGIVFPD